MSSKRRQAPAGAANADVPLAVVIWSLWTSLWLAVAYVGARYLQGEPNQPRYLSAFAAVLAAVRVLLLTDHWLGLIAAWGAGGAALLDKEHGKRGAGVAGGIERL